MALTKQGYGWIPDLPDHRDFIYAAPERVLGALPPKIDLRPDCPIVYDQGPVGSCTANAIGAAHEFLQMKQGHQDIFVPSRLFIYYQEREIEGTVDLDCGAMMRSGIKVIANFGVCPEEPTQNHPDVDGVWPYDIQNLLYEKPSAAIYNIAAEHQAITYSRLQRSINEMKGCLASGYPFVYGFSVYESFENDSVKNTGLVKMPGLDESLITGHAVLAVGYDDAHNWFITRNSWGQCWGDDGYFYMPYQYLLDPDLSDDFWTIRFVEDEV
jgi:C1A family cysteine protease